MTDKMPTDQVAPRRKSRPKRPFTYSFNDDVLDLCVIRASLLWMWIFQTATDRK